MAKYIGRDLFRGNLSYDPFTGNGVQVIFGLTYNPGTISSIAVFVDGIFQQPGSAFSLSGQSITFTEAPYNGAVIVVLYLGLISSTVMPNDYSVTLNKLDPTFYNTLRLKTETRTRINSNLTVYVSTTGNDSNDGLSVGAPFLTLQKAVNVLANNYDFNGFTATIQLADGTYTSGLDTTGLLFSGPVTLNGNSVTPTNVVISTTSSNCIAHRSNGGGSLTVQNIKLQTTTSGSCITSSGNALLNLGVGINFGACAGSHIFAWSFGRIQVLNSYTISGGASVAHVLADLQGQLFINSGITVTLTGTPAFGSYFAMSSHASLVYAVSVTWSGAATGTRYSASGNGVIETSGGGATYFPGSVAGTVTTGGQYI